MSADKSKQNPSKNEDHPLMQQLKFRSDFKNSISFRSLGLPADPGPRCHLSHDA